MLYLLQNTCTLSFNLAIFSSQKQKQKKWQQRQTQKSPIGVRMFSHHRYP